MSKRSKAKVALFLPSLDGGGAERMMLRMAVLLSDESCDVDVVVTRRAGEYVGGLDKTINLVDLGTGRPSRSLFALASYLRKNRRDVIISTLLHANYISVLSSLVSLTHTKCIVREAVSPADDLSADTWATKMLKKILVKLTYPLAYKIVALSHGVALGMRQEFRLISRKIDVIYNPIDSIDIRRQMRLNPAHAWLSENTSVPIFVAVGRLTYQKGYDLLLRAVAKVSEMYEFRVIVLGEGELRLELEGLRDSLRLNCVVDFPGFFENPYSLISRSSGFLFPSRWEGLGNALIEAMCCGVPIAAADCQYGPREVLEHGKHGLLFAPNNVDAISEALVELLEGRVKAPCSEACDRFDPKSVARQYMDLFDVGV